MFVKITVYLIEREYSRLKELARTKSANGRASARGRGRLCSSARQVPDSTGVSELDIVVEAISASEPKSCWTEVASRQSSGTTRSLQADLTGRKLTRPRRHFAPGQVERRPEILVAPPVTVPSCHSGGKVQGSHHPLPVTLGRGRRPPYSSALVVRSRKLPTQSWTTTPRANIQARYSVATTTTATELRKYRAEEGLSLPRWGRRRAGRSSNPRRRSR